MNHRSAKTLLRATIASSIILASNCACRSERPQISAYASRPDLGLVLPICVETGEEDDQIYITIFNGSDCREVVVTEKGGSPHSFFVKDNILQWAIAVQTAQLLQESNQGTVVTVREVKQQEDGTATVRSWQWGPGFNLPPELEGTTVTDLIELADKVKFVD